MMKPALSQVCSLNSPFEKDIVDYAAGQGRAVEIWLTKLETYLQSNSISDVKRLLDENSMLAPVASFQGGLLVSQGAARQEAWSLFKRRLQLCRQLSIETLVIACDITGPVTQQDVDRAVASLSQIGNDCERHGVRGALEFQAKSVIGNNIQTAVNLSSEARSPFLGICLDAMHYFVGPSMSEDLAFLSNENLFHVQLCDLADVPRELATDSDRILPGEGEIPLEPILRRLREMDYNKYVSIELMNPQIWQVPALQFGEIAMTSLRKMLGQASME